MKHSSLITIIGAAVGLLGACSSLNPAHRLGSVKAVSGQTLQVCSGPNDTPPAAGQAVQLVRREQVGHPKGTATFRERRVGTAEIGAVLTERCVEARLVQGKARRHDGVFPDLGDAQPR